MTRRYKTVLFIRFLGYFIFLTGLVSFLAVFSPILRVELNYRWDKIFDVRRIVSEEISESRLPRPSGSRNDISNENNERGFGNINATSNTITPISTDFGIVIEKINANAKVVDADPINEKAYVKALQEGVAHATGTQYPGEKGNIYLFSHSTDAPWNVIRFNAVFYLLRELDSGDRVVMFYKDRRFDYVVFDKQIVKPIDISFLTNKYEDSILTLQTCDPPGTLFNRLIVRAKLAGS